MRKSGAHGRYLCHLLQKRIFKRVQKRKKRNAETLLPQKSQITDGGSERKRSPRQYQQKVLINRSLQSPKREFIEEIIFNNIRKYLCNFQMIQEVGYEITTEDHDFIIEFYCCAITGICIRLMSEHESQIRIEDLIDKIDRLVAGKMMSIK